VWELLEWPVKVFTSASVRRYFNPREITDACL
jgi:hypothetical protein